MENPGSIETALEPDTLAPENSSGEEEEEQQQQQSEEEAKKKGKEEEEEEEEKDDDWKETINRVVPAVVVLRVTACRSFDTEMPSSGSATGFVVDKRRGIILTNRHVVQPGPVVAQAIFVNHEEVPVHPVYIDPVHDFGFYRYDPNTIQFLDYEEIHLAPEAACVGLEIRVVGNDSCEKVSILAGTIARLDRDAPIYRSDGYRDFNTFYMQAASGTKGGSSGSPVIDRQGRAVAMNAGGRSMTSTAFFLPLDQVVRALNFLRKGRDALPTPWKAVSIPRGTLQVTFYHKGFDEARRLGLHSETEKMVRNATPIGETGMLVVDSVVPGGPADMKLEPGDVLVCANGKVITKFLELETLLDDNVDQKIEIQIERGGTAITIDIVVQNLDSITPDHFLEWSGAVIHPLSYQQATNFRLECGLVYVSDPGYILSKAGVPRHAIIKTLADAQITSLEDLISTLSRLSRGARVPLEYISYKDRHRKKSALVTLDRHEWFDSPKVYTRDDNSGLWRACPAIQLESQQVSFSGRPGPRDQDGPLVDGSSLKEHLYETKSQKLTNVVTCSEASSIHAAEEAKSKDKHIIQTRKQQDSSVDGVVHANSSSYQNQEISLEGPTIMKNVISHDHKGAESKPATANASSAQNVIEPALVKVQVDVPPTCLLDGVNSRHYSGTGIIIYHSQGMGLVAVDRNTIVISASDVMLSFAAFPIEVPGEVVFLHPIYNYALVSYNPSALGAVGSSLVRAVELSPEPALQPGDLVYLVGLSKSLRAMSRKSFVTDPCHAIHIASAECPRYRAMNMEVIELDTDFGHSFTGVLCNESGKVQALWGSFSIKHKSRCGSSKDQTVKGIPIYMISRVLDKIIAGANGSSLLVNGVRRQMPLVSILEVEFCPRLLSKARNYGLSDGWIQALVKKDPMRRQVLMVRSCFAGSKAENLLKEGDMLLAINKEPVTCFGDVENACLALENSGENNGKLELTIFRKGHEVDLHVGTDIRDGNGTNRLIIWSGCILHEPHPAVRALGFLPKEGHGVFVSKFFRGSPADRYGLYSLRWIVEVNGKRTPDLDVFINVTKDLRHDEFIRLQTVSLSGRPQVLTLKQDLHYWPTWELKFDPDSAMWRRRTIKALDSSDV